MTRPPSLVDLAQEYLDSRRKLGFALHIEGQQLLRFARYAEKQGAAGRLTIELAVAWATLPKEADPRYWARRLDIVRRFATYRRLFDPLTQVPPEGLLGKTYRRSTPHIYSHNEIQSLLKEAAKLGPAGGLRPKTYVTLFGLLVCTGLRVSEALRLTRTDVDLCAGVLRIVETKFHKSRLVPLHPSTAQALQQYAEQRILYHPQVSSPAFFLTERGTSLKYWRTLQTFVTVRHRLGWTGAEGRPPRIHDLRHTFAVRRLLAWYQEEADVDARIASLSTYLGHVKVTDTYWYLSAVPELMAVTARRYERYAGAEAGGCS